MVKVQINHNPYIVKTEIIINNKEMGVGSPFKYTEDRKLQDWIEPRGGWKGIFQTLRTYTGDGEIQIFFTGTFGDYDDLDYARKKFGNCFQKIELIHQNRKHAKEADPYEKMKKLRGLYQELQDGPVEELKTEDIRKNFEMALNAEFRIFKLNCMKNLQNREEKNELIRLSQIKGSISSLSSKEYTMFFVDTAREKKFQNDEFEEMFDEAVSDENISLIAYVFDGMQASVYDSDKILRKIANVMKSSEDKKQLKDRFIFVADRMDEFDLSEESYEETIEKTILPMLSNNGIIEPDLFLVSTRAAKLIRMDASGEVLSENDEDYLEMLVNKFNKDTRILPEYASLKGASKQRLIDEAKKCAGKAKEYEVKAEEEGLTRKEKIAAKKLKFCAAEINSGIPAVELAIRSYLEKDAVYSKIKKLHDMFMEKVGECGMFENCKTEWEEPEQKLSKLKKEIEEKKKEIARKEKLSELCKKVEGIRIKTRRIKSEQERMAMKINNLINSAKNRIRREEAGFMLTRFNQKLQNIGRDAQIALNDALNWEVQRFCQEIANEYAGYIEDLDEEGLSRIGSFDVTQQIDVCSFFKMRSLEDILQNIAYISMFSEEEIIAVQKVENSGLWSRARARAEEELESLRESLDMKQEYVLFKKLIKEQVAEIQQSLDQEINSVLEKIEVKVKRAMLKMDGGMVNDLTAEIEEMESEYEALSVQIKENKKKEWIGEIIEKMEQLLAV